MEPRKGFPDVNRLSVLAATILLAYALTPFVDLPPRELALQIPGLYLVFTINYQTVTAILAAALAAAGMNWLLSDHPALSEMTGRDRQLAVLPHWLLPSLTAWVIGVPLANLSQGMYWWAVFAMGGLLLVLVMVGEYAVVDIADANHPVAVMGLTALSYALYLVLAITLRAAGVRLYLILPALIPTAALVALRTLYLRSGGKWSVAWTVGIGLVVGQIATGLHYLPVTPVRFGLLLVAPLYALTSLAGALDEGGEAQRYLLEPVTMLVLIGILAIWVR